MTDSAPRPPHTPLQHPAAAGTPDLREAKGRLRRTLLEARRSRSQRSADGASIAAHALAWAPVREAEVVAAYVSVGSEPPTLALLDSLLARGTRVLVPVLLDDNDLDWAEYSGPASLAVAGRGLREPSGVRLGRGAVVEAQAVFVPGLAVSESGERLGRGGGSYDRALARVRAGVPVAVVLHPDEVGLDVPAEPHDRPVTHSITALGVSELTR